MAIAFLALVIVFLVYSSIKRPGIALAYLIFFQVLNNFMFKETGLQALKYSTFLLLLPILYYKTYSKTRFRNFFKRIFNSKLSVVYFMLLIYMTFFAYAIGGSYEYTYPSSFFFPGTILFLMTLYFLNDIKVYKELVSGIIIFSLLTFLFLYLFKGFASIATVDRLEISESIGMGPIAQGRMAGMVGLISLIYLNKSKGRKLFIIHSAIFVVSFLWLSLTGTRGAFVALILTFLFFLLLKQNNVKTIFRAIVFFLLLIPALMYIGVEEFTLFQRLTEFSSQQDIESMERYNRYLIFFNLPPENFVLGLGPGGWGKHIRHELYSYPHNIVLESIIEYGIVGVIFVFTTLILGIRLVVKIVRNKFSNLYFVILSLCWLYYLINTMVSGSFLRNINFFTLTAVLICLQLKIKDKKLLNG